MENFNDIFSKNIDYMIHQVDIDLNHEIINLKEDFYFELSRDEIINYFKKTLSVLKNWKKNFNSNNIQSIIDEYKDLEGIIAELELCLADYEFNFRLNGISYSLFEIGKVLNFIEKENDKYGR